MMQGFGNTVREVMMALLPLLGLFVVANVLLKRLAWKKIVGIFSGFVFILLGLSLFLQGVYAGFLPMGKAMGEALGTWPHKWILIPLGFILGFAGTLAEPAVRVLNYQVEKITSGYIPQKIMLFTLSSGVGIAVSLAMLRIIMGFSLRTLILPGYILAFILMIFSSRSFVAIAFDSGGVASGPMTATFITAMTIGVASGIEGRDPLVDGLGLVALVAMLPIITVLLLGFLYSRQERRLKANISGE
jgi:hypothetical protein